MPDTSLLADIAAVENDDSLLADIAAVEADAVPQRSNGSGAYAPYQPTIADLFRRGVDTSSVGKAIVSTGRTALRLTPAGDVLTGAEQGVNDLAGTLSLLAGQEDVARDFRQRGDQLETEQATATQANPVAPEWGSRMLRGASRSLTTSLPGAVIGGPGGAIAMGMAQGGASKFQDRREDGADTQTALAAALRQAGYEGIPAAIMQRLGLGGAETMLADAFRRGGVPAVREILARGVKAGIQEIPEEMVTTNAELADQATSTDQAPSWRDVLQANIDTAGQAFLAPNILSTVQAGRRLAQGDPEQQAMEQASRAAALAPGNVTAGTPRPGPSSQDLMARTIAAEQVRRGLPQDAPPLAPVPQGPQGQGFAGYTDEQPMDQAAALAAMFQANPGPIANEVPDAQAPQDPAAVPGGAVPGSAPQEPGAVSEAQAAPVAPPQEAAAPLAAVDLVARHRQVAAESARWRERVGLERQNGNTAAARAAFKKAGQTEKLLRTIEERMTPEQVAAVRPPVAAAPNPLPEQAGIIQQNNPAPKITPKPAAAPAPTGQPAAATSMPAETVEQAAAQANPKPTEAQKEAGNYAKGHVRLHGMNIAIENRQGSIRSGTDINGKPWSVTMPAHYGYVKGTTGADGDHVDLYIGPKPDATQVYVIDQVDAKTGKFDEHKAMLGFPSIEAATTAYDAAFSDGKGPQRRAAITTMGVDQFKKWSSSRQAKRPLAKLPKKGPDVRQAAAPPAPQPAPTEKPAVDVGSGGIQRPAPGPVQQPVEREPTRSPAPAAQPEPAPRAASGTPDGTAAVDAQAPSLEAPAGASASGPVAPAKAHKERLFQGRGATPEQVYGPEAVAEGRAAPLFGKAQYYATTAEDAKQYGEVTQHDVELRKPFILDSDKKWMALIKQADAPHLDNMGERFYSEPSKIPAAGEKVQQFLRSKGYDGIVVRLDNNGDGTKRLNNMVGHDQTVAFENTAKAESAAPAAPVISTPENFKSTSPTTGEAGRAPGEIARQEQAPAAPAAPVVPESRVNTDPATVNLPLDKRGSGSLDAQIDRGLADERKRKAMAVRDAKAKAKGIRSRINPLPLSAFESLAKKAGITPKQAKLGMLRNPNETAAKWLDEQAAATAPEPPAPEAQPAPVEAPKPADAAPPIEKPARKPSKLRTAEAEEQLRRISDPVAVQRLTEQLYRLVNAVGDPNAGNGEVIIKKRENGDVPEFLLDISGPAGEATTGSYTTEEALREAGIELGAFGRFRFDDLTKHLERIDNAITGRNIKHGVVGKAKSGQPTRDFGAGVKHDQLKRAVPDLPRQKAYSQREEDARPAIVNLAAINKDMKVGRVVQVADGWRFVAPNGRGIGIRSATAAEARDNEGRAEGYLTAMDSTGEPAIVLIPGRSGEFTVNHELVHHARRLGVLKDGHLDALVRIGTANGIAKKWAPLYKQANPDISAETLREEIAAKTVEAIKAGDINIKPGWVQRVLDWFADLGRALAGMPKSDLRMARDVVEGTIFEGTEQGTAKPADAGETVFSLSDEWMPPERTSTPDEAIRSLSRLSLWKRNGDAAEVDWNKRDAAWHIKQLGMTMPEFWNQYGDQITAETNRVVSEYEGHKERTPQLDGLRQAFKDGESNYRLWEILKYDLGVDLGSEMFSLADPTAPRTPQERLEAARQGVDAAKKPDDRPGILAELRRHFKHLDPAKHAEAIAILRNLEAQLDGATGTAERAMLGHVDGLTREQAEAFNDRLVLEDVLRQIEAGEFDGGPTEDGRTAEQIGEQIKADHAKAIEKGGKPAADAYEKRRAFQAKHTRALVEADLLDPSALDDSRYYHRQVLAHLGDKASMGLGGADARQRRRGFQKGRSGGTANDIPFYGNEEARRDFNANYAQAEFEYLAQSIQELARHDALQRLDARYNQMRAMKAEAKARNRAAMDEAWAKENTVEATGERDEDAISKGWDTHWRGLLAMNNAGLAELAMTDNFGGPFDDVWTALGEAREKWHGENDHLDRGDKMPFMFDHPAWWKAIAWLASHPEITVTVTPEKGASYEQKPAIHAMAIFKAIAERDQHVKDTLGKAYQTWENVADEQDGLTTWQPEEGLQLVPGWAATDQAIGNALRKAGLDEATVAEALPEKAPVGGALKRGLIVMGQKPQWLINEDLAKQLNSMRRVEDTPALRRAMETWGRSWKLWMLHQPFRVIKYQLNNAVGDLDVALTQPGIMREVFKDRMQTARDLWAFTHGKKLDPKTEAQMKAAMQHGILDSGVSAAELPDVDKLPALRALFGKQGWDMSWAGIPEAAKRYFDSAQRFGRWREAIMRVSAARALYRQVSPEHRRYAASRKDELDQLYDRWQALADQIDAIGSRQAPTETDDTKARDAEAEIADLHATIAAKLARELIGDYGNLSHAGQVARRFLIPFWSFMEINAPRYVRLIKNARYEGGSGGARAAGVAAVIGAKLGVRMVALSAGVFAWNAMMKAILGIRDDEDPNKDADLSKLLIILGRDKDGKAYGVRVAGALADAMGWLDLDNAVSHIKEIRDGFRDGHPVRAGMEVVADTIQAPVNKLVQGLTPVIKVPGEQVFGKTIFPDMFHPRPLGDRYGHLADAFAMGGVYRAATDRTGWGKAIGSAVVATHDPGQASHYRVRDDAEAWAQRNGKTIKSGGGTPKEQTNMLREAKAAFMRGEADRADRWLWKYYDLGGKPSFLGASKAAAHPLSVLKKDDQPDYLKQLSPEKRAEYSKALARWNQLWGGMDGMSAAAARAYQAWLEKGPKPKS